MSIQNGLIISGAAIALAVVAVLAAMSLFYGSIYRFDQTANGPETYGLAGVSEVTFTSEDGAEVAAWIRPPAGDAPVILYFMGNFTSIGPSLQRLKPFLDEGLGVAALVYRGSGGKPGAPSEEAFAADARALYDRLNDLIQAEIPAKRRVAHGYSLGSGIAVRLATERPVAALTLEAAYARFCDYFTDKYYGLPFCAVMTKERYDSIDRIGRIGAPLMMFHGEQDDAIAISSARRLFEAAKDPKEFRDYADGNHVNLAEKGLVAESFGFYRKYVAGSWING